MSDTEAPEVTFVGGRAIEQTEAADSNVDAETREDAMAAVREAIQKAGEESADDAKTSKGKDPFKPEGTTPERGEDGKFLPKDGKAAPKKEEPKTEEEELDLDKATVKQLLKAREKVAAIKKDAKDEVSLARRQLEQERAQFQEQQRAIQAEYHRLQQERESWKNLRKDPARAIKDAGYDPEQFILDLAKEGTPEGKAERELRELKEQIASMNDWKRQQAEHAETQRYNYQLAQVQQHRAAAVETFTKLGMNEEKYPHVANFYKGNEKGLIAIGDLTAEDYRTLSGGKEGSFEDILDYLEEDLADRANAWYTKRGKGNSKVESPKVQAKPSKSNGKSLNPDSSGERRALQQKDIRDLDADERLDAARQAVKIALTASNTD